MGLLGVCTAAFSVAKSAFSLIGSAVISVCARAFGPEKVLEKVLIVKELFVGVGRLFGLIDSKEENMDELGDRILQGDINGIKREDFTSFDEYKEKIRNIDLDENLSKGFTTEEKLSSALAYYMSLFEEKLKVDLGKGEDFVKLLAQNPEYFNLERLSKYFKEFSESDYSIGKVVGYFGKSDMSIKDEKKIEERLCKLEKMINIEKQDSDILRELDSIRK